MITAFFFGSGSVENSWKPVIRALHKFNPRVVDQYGANIEMCRIVYLSRLHHQSFAKRFAIAPVDAGLELCQNSISRLSRIRQLISTEIAKSLSDGELSMRQEFEEIFRSFVLNTSSRFFVASTNWDSAGENEIAEWSSHRFGKSEAFATNRIHGRYDDPDTIYMPLETYFESYFGFDKFQRHAELQLNFIDNTRLIERLVIYGLSFSPLDIELFHTLDIVVNDLNGKVNDNLKEVMIIDPSPRAVFLNILPAFRSSQKIAFKGYAPDNLKHPIDLT